MARKVVLAGACRTAIGVMGGALKDIPAPDLGTIVIKEALKRSGVKPEQVDEVYMGCVIQAGTGQNVARQAAVNAGIPVEVPATTINVLCGSGLHCVNLAAKLVGERLFLVGLWYTHLAQHEPLFFSTESILKELFNLESEL